MKGWDDLDQQQSLPLEMIHSGSAGVVKVHVQGTLPMGATEQSSESWLLEI
jgi:hypothetical protein